MDCTPYPHYLDFLMPFILIFTPVFAIAFGVALAHLLTRHRNNSRAFAEGAAWYARELAGVRENARAGGAHPDAAEH